MLLGIDLGTSSVKALLLAPDGAVAGEALHAYPVLAPHPGWSETDPEAWWTAVIAVVHQAVGARGGDIRAIGLAGQMHANLKTVCTHCGIDVGEDGPTHQGMDTIGLLRKPFYGEAYCVTPGAWDWLREGRDGLIAAWGVMTWRALAAAQQAEQHGLDVGVVSIPSLDPPSDETLARLRQAPWVVTVEDHWADTGVGGWRRLPSAEHRVRHEHALLDSVVPGASAAS